MKRTIELYIDGIRADLDTNGLILMNYALTDLEKPSAVKNSYSKQITLPGTPTNANIFGHIFRVDRVAATGFNAGRKTPFEVFNAMGEKVLTGYIRLDSVVRKGQIISAYKCSLFGGLGEFFYCLSYDDEGNKRTLASLDYLGTGEADELDFVINKDTILAAWARLEEYHPSVGDKWDVINFAPAYNGCPDGDFSADKGIVSVADVGLTDNVVDGGETYKSNGGLTLVNLPTPVDEWAAKDLRSYLQRPVISMQAFLEAIANPANNGGYEVDFSSIPLNCRHRVWKTLPTLPSLGTLKAKQGTIDSTQYVPQGGTDGLVGVIAITQSVPGGVSKLTATWKGRIYQQPSDTTPDNYFTARYWNHNLGTNKPAWREYEYGVTFVQLVGYDSNGIALGGSPVKMLGEIDWATPQQIAEAANFTPVYPGVEIEGPNQSWGQLPKSYWGGGGNSGWSGYAYYSNAVELKCVADGAMFFRVYTHSFLVKGRDSLWMDGHPYGRPTIDGTPESTGAHLRHFVDSSANAVNVNNITASCVSRSVTYTTYDDVRSGSYISKSLLLSSKYTPAEYLISYCKMFGFLFVCNQAEKKIKILTRNDFYNTELPVIDLTTLVDRGKDITILPQKVAGKWYEFHSDMVIGAFAEEYKNTYGVDYGIQRVNTGYDFDANAVNLMDGVVYRQAVTLLQHNKYWVKITAGGKFKPSPFLDKGVTYTLWSQADGKAKAFDVPGIPSSATLYFYNYDHDYYDYDGSVLRIECADKENKPLDGEDILLYKGGRASYDGFKVSDDSAAMFTLNDGKPCWDLSLGEGTLGVPTFGQHRIGSGANEYNIWYSLNYGIPKEVDIPDCHFAGWLGCMYGRYWRNYLADLLNTDTKVMKCRVDLSKLEVGPELLRRFFYYEGNIWVLNKIGNYSMTTWDPAECEFVQVQDKANYTEGQIFDSFD